MNPAFRGGQRPRTLLCRLHLSYNRHHYHQLPTFLSASFSVTRPISTHRFHIHAPLRITTCNASTVATSKPQYAEGVDTEQLHPILTELQAQGWSLDEERIGIQKTFYFRSYFKAVSFVNVVASQSATKKHHATMTVRIGSVDIHWTTHHPRGLTEKDTSMAQYCEQAAQLMGNVQEGQGKKCGPGP